MGVPEQSRRGPENRLRNRRPASPASVHWPSTLVARGVAQLRPDHLKYRPPATLDSELHCFLLDCSASMRTGGGLERAKGLLLSLMDEAYRRRHRVALLCFSGAGVRLELAPRRAAFWNERWVAPIGGSGGTPLAQGVDAADQLLRGSRAERRLFWLLTDGRTRERPGAPMAADLLHVIDFEAGRFPLARAAQLAGAWGAAYQHYQDILCEPQSPPS